MKGEMEEGKEGTPESHVYVLSNRFGLAFDEAWIEGPLWCDAALDWASGRGPDRCTLWARDVEDAQVAVHPDGGARLSDWSSGDMRESLLRAPRAKEAAR